MPSGKVTNIVSIIEEKIRQTNTDPTFKNEGRIVSLADGVATVSGLSDVVYGELVEFEGGGHGVAMNLWSDSVDIVILTGIDELKEGFKASSTGRVFEVPVGETLLGRVVNALGEPLDARGPISQEHKLPVERVAPGVITRQSVHIPMRTGLKAVDVMIPVGRGQRELIIGDRQTGKTAIAIDAILNQKDTGVKCVYVAIGQKQSNVANLVSILQSKGAMEYTTVVLASAADSAAMQYISAYSGCTMGEYYRDKGEDALIIYDDLSKHAVAYRQISLLLRRPPGREAYPGDIFYLHSRLLERAASVNAAYVSEMTGGRVKKEGSLTALPIIETQGGDISSFVPTNVISITDGQIFLESDLFNAGLRPAINVGQSVSRVGGSAQSHIVKKLGGSVRIALAQYRELAAFAQFASDLDPATRRQLERGQRVTQLMKQKQYSPLSDAEIALSLVFSESEFLMRVKVNDINSIEAKLLQYCHTHHQKLLDEINEDPTHSKERIQKIKDIIEQFEKEVGIDES